MLPPLRVLRDSFPDEPGLDTALSRTLLLRASSGDIPETFRLNVPGRVVAFGKRDTIGPRYAPAVAEARSRGYEAVERLAGGRAAVFHEGTLAFSWAIPDGTPKDGITARFEMISALMVAALAGLGVGARVGEVPGEYCPGGYSVNAGGSLKVMGVGQRLAKHAAHVGGVVVVSGSEPLRDILIPVYSALGLDWDPNTAGAIQDVAPQVTLQQTADAILSELAATRSLVAGSLSAETIDMARALAPEHLSPNGHRGR